MHHDDDFSRAGRDFRSRTLGDTLRSGFDRARDFIQTRRSEHWVMFFAGLVAGLIIG